MRLVGAEPPRPNDEAIVLALREEFRLCETDTQRYDLCVQKRDELLDQQTRLQTLAAACERVMSSECPEYGRRKKAKSQDSATDGSALKEVVRCWGRDVVQHYQWSSKGEKYCNQLRATARRVPVWEEAVVGLNWSMLQRSRDIRRRPVKALVNPIEQADLDSLRSWSREDPFPCKRLAAKDLPDTFGFDKYGLMVYKEFAVGLAGPDGTGTTEAPAVPETNGADITEPPE
ncbi:uncharacterized protein C8A04DRAFT_12237 [Dichotomopilus funicola]|uniref:Uncharacterized protein n=1 Tax=Dichotomopilus funicola TaxID=1934379 RepID=A0AAN6ZM67_9PEZI|nr:hypothetical protein C8A04DRAFT_12237 [Dichotomopilus funicola]